MLNRSAGVLGLDSLVALKSCADSPAHHRFPWSIFLVNNTSRPIFDRLFSGITIKVKLLYLLPSQAYVGLLAVERPVYRTSLFDILEADRPAVLFAALSAFQFQSDFSTASFSGL